MPRSSKSSVAPLATTSRHINTYDNKKVAPAPQVQPQPISVPQPSFGQIVKEGFGLGAGQAIAHRAVSAILGPTQISVASAPPTETKISQSSCETERHQFESCLKSKSFDSDCDSQMFALKQCIQLK
jgi:hypothetical protein